MENKGGYYVVSAGPNSCIKEAAGRCFLPRARKPTKHWLSAVTLQMVTERRAHLNVYLRHASARRRAALTACIRAWERRVREAAETFEALAVFRPGSLKSEAVVYSMADVVRASVRHDRAVYPEEVVGEAAHADGCGGGRTAFSCIRRLSKFKATPLPCFASQAERSPLMPLNGHKCCWSTLRSSCPA